jgi:hypothetical protein
MVNACLIMLAATILIAHDARPFKAGMIAFGNWLHNI